MKFLLFLLVLLGSIVLGGWWLARRVAQPDSRLRSIVRDSGATL